MDNVSSTYENVHIQTAVIDFSKQVHSISRTFLRQNVLNCCNLNSLMPSCLGSSNKIVAIVSRIANSCVGQSVTIIIIVVSVKREYWHKSSAHNKEFLGETKHIL